MQTWEFWFNPNSKVKGGRNPVHGERMPPACGFRRPAENFVPQISFPGKESKVSLTKAWASRPSLHAGRVRSPFPISEFGLKSRNGFMQI